MRAGVVDRQRLGAGAVDALHRAGWCAAPDAEAEQDLGQQHDADHGADRQVVEEAFACSFADVDVEHHHDEQEQHGHGADIDDRPGSSR